MSWDFEQKAAYLEPLLEGEIVSVTVARQLLRQYASSPGIWPTEYIPARHIEAEAELLGPSVSGSRGAGR